ncbi:MAG: patatin-like protein [Sphingomonadaceae bacterium]|nr:patatin-like protein [Sphingomonadaceae bacterium]
MRERELRLALVCYGGVSLAVYMHGVTKEIWKLLRASRAARDGQPNGLSDSERVYYDMFGEVRRARLKLSVLVDIVAGSSAGGINAVFLSHAITTGQDFDCLTRLWLESADIDKLLDPAAAPATRFSKLYAEPIAWMANRRYQDLLAKVAPETRGEIRAKLSRLIRSRWFTPPFSGLSFTNALLRAFRRMADAPAGPPLLPPGLPFDLFVTVTDFPGHPERLRLHSPPEVIETEHRLTIGFHDSGNRLGRNLGAVPELALAARATASIPGGFPPFRLAEMDEALMVEPFDWPAREAFIARHFPTLDSEGRSADSITLIDGGVLDNAPFRAAIGALRNRPSNREVDRRFLFIDPTPGQSFFRIGPDAHDGTPGYLTTLFRSLSDIPREQPIRDNLEALHALSRRIRRLNYAREGMRPAVESAIDRAFGHTILLSRQTPGRLRRLRSEAHQVAARESGFIYPAYGQLKLSGVVEMIAELIIDLGRHGARMGGSSRVRDALWRHLRQFRVTQVEAPPAALADASPYVLFLRAFDIGFRVRRMRAVIRALSAIAAEMPDGSERETLEAVKLDLYALLTPFIQRYTPGFYGPEVAAAAALAHDNAAAALDAVSHALQLQSLDEATDARFVDVLSRLPTETRRQALIAYLGFPFFDVATLPLHQEDGLDEAEEIKIDRIAPNDSHFLRPGDATLRGVQFASFGAFFARSYRENDYLWGRLHAAERLIDIVFSTLPEEDRPPAAVSDRLKARLCGEILDAEEPKLKTVGSLIAELKQALGARLRGDEPSYPQPVHTPVPETTTAI